jgi:hypothetical protein
VVDEAAGGTATDPDVDRATCGVPDASRLDGNSQLRDNLTSFCRRPIPTPTNPKMATIREGARLASSLGRRQLPLRTAPLCARRLASTEADKSSALADLDSASSFATGAPDEAAIQAFNNRERASGADNRLPGNRFVTQWL